VRKAVAFILSIVLAALLVFPACATAVSNLSAYSTVTRDGSCQISLQVSLHLSQAVEGLTFPVPLDATAVLLNGSRVRMVKTDSAKHISLSRVAGQMAGDASFTVQYTLKDVITETPTGLQLELPLLSGFSYPVQNLEFSVTLPDAIAAKPAFSSGYHQSSIEQDLSVEVNGAVVTGKSVAPLKDHETLVMLLPVTEELFPQTILPVPSFDALYIVITVCAVLALGYWLLTMRCAPPRRITATTSPDGYNAGELGSILQLQGGDLTMMALSWAQLGYLLIQLDRKGRVSLYKQMDMGNERSNFEQRCFQSLFGKRNVVDTTSLSYALLSQKIAAMRPSLQSFVLQKNGNRNVFRGLGALICMLFGVCLGISLSAGAILQWLLVILLGIFGLLSGWHIQTLADSVCLYRQPSARRALILCGVWLILGLISGQFGLAVLACCSQLLVGLMSAFGGRRTDAGRQAMSQVLGLRRYLRNMSSQEAQRIHQQNPEYFYALMPYAIALGVDKAFAAHFRSLRLPECAYLSAGTDTPMGAPEWSRLLRRTVESMNARRQRLSSERFLSFLQGFLK